MKRRFFWKTSAMLAASGLVLAFVLTGCPMDDNGTQPDITWTATANSTSTTAIDFTFSRNIPSGLNAAHITVNPMGDARVTKGTLNHDWGEHGSLGLTVVEAGNVAVSINFPGVDPGPRMVTVQPIAWTANVNCTTNTTFIYFSFGELTCCCLGRPNLTAGHISVVDGTGAVTTGTFDDGWNRLHVTVVEPGNVSVSINLPGVDPEPRVVSVSSQPITPITWTATANCTTNTTAIDFTFGEWVWEMTAAHVTVSPIGNARVTTGNLWGSGMSRSLAVSVVEAGNVSVSINFPGIDPETRLITVHSPIAWTATPDSTTYTTAIDFTFTEAAPGMTSEHIRVYTSQWGSRITTGALTGTGISRSLDVADVGAGNVWIVVDFPRVVSEGQYLTVHREPITWTAYPNSPTTTTAINFTFSEPVPGLTAGHITVWNQDGRVTTGALTGSGLSRSLAIDVVEPGDLEIRIDFPRVESEGWWVRVHRPLITWTVAPNSTTNTTALNFTFSESVPGLISSNILVNQGWGYSPTGGTLTGTGTSRSLDVTDLLPPRHVSVRIDFPRAARDSQPVMIHRQ